MIAWLQQARNWVRGMTRLTRHPLLTFELIQGPLLLPPSSVNALILLWIPD